MHLVACMKEVKAKHGRKKEKDSKKDTHSCSRSWEQLQMQAMARCMCFSFRCGFSQGRLTLPVWSSSGSKHLMLLDIIICVVLDIIKIRCHQDKKAPLSAQEQKEFQKLNPAVSFIILPTNIAIWDSPTFTQILIVKGSTTRRKCNLGRTSDCVLGSESNVNRSVCL